MASIDEIRFLHFADTHLGFDYPLKPRIARRRRGPDFFSNYQKILDYARLSKPDFLVHGGDFFFRSKVHPKIVDFAYKPLIDLLDENDIPIFIVPGNHERSRLPQSIYLAHKHINIFDKPRTYQLKINNTAISISGFPFVRKNIRQSFSSILKESSWPEILGTLNLLVLHQAVDGANVGPVNFTFRNKHDVINIKDIPDNTGAVLCGHIHRRQILYQNNIPVIYPGSIERTAFAEKDEQKGFYEISAACDDKKNWKIKKARFLRLPSRPMEDIYINCSESQDFIRKSIINQLAKLASDSIVRIKCKPATVELSREDLTTDFFRAFIPNTINFQFGSGFYRKVENNKEIGYTRNIS